MITKEKLEELRQKMIHHDVVNDQAVVTITAAELYDLITAAEGHLADTDVGQYRGGDPPGWRKKSIEKDQSGKSSYKVRRALAQRIDGRKKK